ncbi:MAG: hypothetical protein EAZ62_06545, partial [Sphingobacteriia bacterium]
TDLVLASEGSFGPHPSLGFVPANEEILFLQDAKHNRTYRVKTLQTATNFAQAHCSDWASLKNFAERVRFPSHALILRNSHHLHKGINTWTAMENIAAEGFPWEASTDMRAHLNPSRQAVIALATKDLVDLLNSFCPACAAPGFGVSAVHPGLACAWCQFPTRLTQAWTKTCEVCGHNETIDFPQGEKTADPQYCDRCNP